jgi:hypothetical protein
MEELKLKWEAPTKLTRKSLDGYYYLEKINVGYGCRVYANTKFFGIYSNLTEAKEACERDRITSAKLEAERPEPIAEEVERAAEAIQKVLDAQDGLFSGSSINQYLEATGQDKVADGEEVEISFCFGNKDLSILCAKAALKARDE